MKQETTTHAKTNTFRRGKDRADESDPEDFFRLGEEGGEAEDGKERTVIPAKPRLRDPLESLRSLVIFFAFSCILSNLENEGLLNDNVQHLSLRVLSNC